MGERSKSLGEGRHWVGDQIRKAKVVNGEKSKGMEMRVEAGDVGRKDGDGLGGRDKLSRL